MKCISKCDRFQFLKIPVQFCELFLVVEDSVDETRFLLLGSVRLKVKWS